MNYKNIHYGKNIRRLRGVLGMNQEELAEKMKISQQKVSKYENESMLDDEVLNKVAEAMGISVDNIKDFEPEDLVNYFTNNFNGGGSFINNFGKGQNVTINNNETIDRIVNLYEKMLVQSEKEKDELKKRIDKLEAELRELRYK